jgi:ribose transport system substrate-binding protein
MKKQFSALVVLLLMISVVLAACGKGNTDGASSAAGSQPPASSMASSPSASPSAAASASAAPAGEPLSINQSLPDKEILSKGPNGETATSAKSLQLTADEVAKIKDGHYKAAIAMHYAGNDWSTAQIKGLTDAFGKMGIEIVATTDANFKAETQVANIETILSKQPNIIVSIPVDPVSTADAYKKAAAAGVKLVFMDNKPNGLEAGKDYVGVVSADNYGNGVESANIMAKELGDAGGDIGVIFHDADFFVTKQRTDAFEKTIKEKYPKIKIVDRGGIQGPNDGEKVAAAMLTKHPKLKGIFVVWDVPAEGAMAAARSAGRNDLVITTCDLGTNVALEMASGGLIKGLGAQLPYDQGTAEAILAAYSLLGKPTSSYYAVPALPVTKDNILDAWKTVYHSDAPSSIQDAAKK